MTRRGALAATAPTRTVDVDGVRIGFFIQRRRDFLPRLRRFLR